MSTTMPGNFGSKLFEQNKFFWAMLAVDENFALGSKGELLCHLPQDLQHFKKQTLKQALLLGRKTLISLPNSLPLPNRYSIILTNNKDGLKTVLADKIKNSVPSSLRQSVSSREYVIVNTPTEVLENLRDYDNLVLIGGATLYNQFSNDLQAWLVTHIKHRFLEADTHLDQNIFQDLSLVYQTPLLVDGDYSYSVALYANKHFLALAKQQAGRYSKFLANLNSIKQKMLEFFQLEQSEENKKEN